MNVKETCVWNARIFYALLGREWQVFKSGLKRRLINTLVWTAFLVYVFEYIGLANNAGYGLFVGCGECATQGFYRIFGLIVAMVADLEGPRRISYLLTLPISSRLVFLSFAVSAMIRVIVMAAPILIITKLVLWDYFDLAYMSIFKVVSIFLCIHFFYGALYVVYAGYISSIEGVRVIRTRFADMLFWIGGFYFTWQRLYQKSHFFAYLDLLNPLIYASEGMRAAVIGQEGYLPFWWCCFALLVYGAICIIVGTRKLMKKLDCVF